MSNNQVVIQSLIKQREQLIDKKLQAIAQFDADVLEIEKAIEILSGKKLGKEPFRTEPYDDENPDYITGNEDGI